MIDDVAFIHRLEPIFREELEQDDLKITMQTRKADIDAWDSLAHVRIVIGVERAFDLQLEVAEIESIDSVEAFFKVVNNHAG